MFEPAVYMLAYFASFTSPRTHTKKTSSTPRHSCWQNLRARRVRNLFDAPPPSRRHLHLHTLHLFSHITCVHTHTHSYIIFTTFPACNGGAHAPENESGNRCQGHKDNVVVAVCFFSPSALITRILMARRCRHNYTYKRLARSPLIADRTNRQSINASFGLPGTPDDASGVGGERERAKESEHKSVAVLVGARVYVLMFE